MSIQMKSDQPLYDTVKLVGYLHEYNNFTFSSQNNTSTIYYGKESEDDPFRDSIKLFVASYTDKGYNYTLNNNVLNKLPNELQIEFKDFLFKCSVFHSKASMETYLRANNRGIYKYP